MALTGEIKGRNKLSSQLSGLKIQLPKDQQKEMLKIIIEMDAEVKNEISRGGRTGKIYGNHQASAEGEAPKTDTGALVAGFLFDVRGTAKNIIGRIRNVSSHAAPLEFKPKTQGGRPFMRPLYNRWAKEATRRLGMKTKSATRKVVKK